MCVRACTETVIMTAAKIELLIWIDFYATLPSLLSSSCSLKLTPPLYLSLSSLKPPPLSSFTPPDLCISFPPSLSYPLQSCWLCWSREVVLFYLNFSRADAAKCGPNLMLPSFFFTLYFLINLKLFWTALWICSTIWLWVSVWKLNESSFLWMECLLSAEWTNLLWFCVCQVFCL